MLRSSKSCIPHFVFLKAASRVLRRLFAEIERRTDPVTIQINQRCDCNKDTKIFQISLIGV
ncbi:hypothetical protein V1478_002208 [Vespula squamosa]|uniref:Uncharacterized protein n=1 Tax=Vespula squamosa TaxID=30214 RepID=A0ABD2BVN8_VESSQ